jgi:repressor LexA
MGEEFNSEQFYILVGKNIEKYRKLQNDTLESLAGKMGLTKKTIHRYENGVIRIDIERLIQIASALNTSVAKLTDGILIFDKTKMVR